MSKKRFFLFLKILVSLSLIGWLVYKADTRTIVSNLKGCDLRFFVLVYVSILINNFVQVLRWQCLLRDETTAPSFWRLLQYHMIGNFFQGFLPSSMSVDIVKGYLLSKTEDPKKAYGSLLMGRLMGVAVLLAFFLLLVIFRPQWVLHESFSKQMAGVAALFIAGCAVVFSKKVSRFLFSRFERLSATPLFKKIKSFREELYHYRYQYKALGLSLLASSVIFISSIFATYFSFRAVHFNVPFLTCMIYIPVVYAVLLLPVSINGIGLREGLMLMFFKSFGLTNELLLSSSALAYAVIYSIYLLGGVVYLFSGFKGVSHVKKEA